MDLLIGGGGGGGMGREVTLILCEEAAVAAFGRPTELACVSDGVAVESKWLVSEEETASLFKLS